LVGVIKTARATEFCARYNFFESLRGQCVNKQEKQLRCVSCPLDVTQCLGVNMCRSANNRDMIVDTKNYGAHEDK